MPARPTDLDVVLSSFHVTKSRLDRSITALECVKAGREAELRASEEMRLRIVKLEQSQTQSEGALHSARAQSEDLRQTLKRSRADTSKASAESLALVSHLKTRLGEAQDKNKTLQAQISQMIESVRPPSEVIARQVYGHEQDKDEMLSNHANGTGGLTAENEELKKRLAESEFGQNALREGGARLTKEVERLGAEMEKLTRKLRGGLV